MSTNVIFWDLLPGTGENDTKNREKKKSWVESGKHGRGSRYVSHRIRKLTRAAEDVLEGQGTKIKIKRESQVHQTRSNFLRELEERDS